MLEEPSYRKDGSRTSGRIMRLNHQRYLAVVVDEAHACKSLMCNTLAQRDWSKVAEKDASLRGLLVKCDHEWLILWSDRPNHHGYAGSRRPRADVLRGVWTNNRLRQLLTHHSWLMNYKQWSMRFIACSGESILSCGDIIII
jgi:hypothetical protein